MVKAMKNISAHTFRRGWFRMHPPELISQLRNYGVSVQLAGDNFKTYLPSSWTSWYDAPEKARPLLRELKARRKEILAYLKTTKNNEPETCTVASKAVQLHQMRPSCCAAGHCLREVDCNLFPVRLGWCRERVVGTFEQKTVPPHKRDSLGHRRSARGQ